MPVVYVNINRNMCLLSAPGLVEKLHELRQQQAEDAERALPAANHSLAHAGPPTAAASTPTQTATSTASTTSALAIDGSQHCMIDLTVDRCHPCMPLRSPKRRGTDTTDAPSIKKARQDACPPPSVLRAVDPSGSREACRDKLVRRLRLAEQTSTLTVHHNDGRCVLTAVLVALGKVPAASHDPQAASDSVIDQSCRDLVARLQQWTEPMWVRHVPAVLRQRHWHHHGVVGQYSSFRTYLDLLKNGGSSLSTSLDRLDHCVLYVASLEYRVSIHVVNASDAPPSFTVTRIRPGCEFSRHIVLFHTSSGHYEVVQHQHTTVFDNDQHRPLLRRLRQIPTPAVLSVADPEVNERELEMGGYERAPTLIGEGAFARVYRVTSKDVCAHPRAHALKIASSEKNDVMMVQREVEALERLAGHPGVPRLLQVVGGRAFSMEYCVGQSLEKAMKRLKHLPVAVCIEVFRQLLCTIQHAHKAGLLHRDIKPANILLRHKLTRTSTTHDVDVVLADWGLSINRTDKQSRGTSGTPRYLPPEVLSGEQPFDPTCDVWAAGCVLAQMLRGGAPLFPGEVVQNWQEQLHTLLDAEVPRDDIRKLLHAVLSPRSDRPMASKVLLMLSTIDLNVE